MKLTVSIVIFKESRSSSIKIFVNTIICITNNMVCYKRNVTSLLSYQNYKADKMKFTNYDYYYYLKQVARKISTIVYQGCFPVKLKL